MNRAVLTKVRILTHLTLFLCVGLYLSLSDLSAQCTNPTIALPDVSIPVDGNIENAYCVTLTFDPDETGLPLGISMNLFHTWQGDLGIWIFANGSYLNIVQRPGVLGSCEGDCPCGSSDGLGALGSPSTYTFTDSGTDDPENGLSPLGGDYGITQDDECGLGTPGINSFADLWATFAPGEEISAELCISDHAGIDSGIASDVSFIFPNPVICGCTDPIADNYNPDANVDDGSCTYVCPPFGTTINTTLSEFCAGGEQVISLVVSAPEASGATYQWTGSNGGTVYLSSTTSNATIATMPAGFTGAIRYQVIVTDDEGCEDVAISDVVVYPLPNLNLESPPAICAGETIVLTAPSGYAVYDWNTGDSTMSIAVNSSGTYALTVTDVNGCVGEDAISLQEVPLPLPRIVGPESIFLGEEVPLRVLSSFSEYNWSNGDTGNLIMIDTPGVYNVTVTDDNGCEGIAEINIGEEFGYNLYIPNAFSPNLDGINDDFFFQSDGRSVRSVVNMRVFDRWGGLIFENADFPPDMPQEGWDGRQDGQVVRSGVYVWIASVELSSGEVVKVQGDVLLTGGR